MTTGIYMIWVRNPRGDVHSYVGRAVNIERRWAQHRADLEAGRHNKKFLNVYRKYGLDALTWAILEEFPEGTPEADLERAEQAWLELEFGTMNVSRSAGGGVGIYACPDVRARHRAKMAALYEDPEHRAKNKAAIQKLAQDPEWRANQKAGAQKRTADPEWRANQKAAAQKCAADPEWRANQKAGAVAAAKHPLRLEALRHSGKVFTATRRGDHAAAAFHRAEAARLNAAYRAEKEANNNI